MNVMATTKRFTILLCALFCLTSTSSFAQVLNESQGTGAGINITTGDYNTIYGDSSGFSLTSGSRNVILGFGAGKSLTTSEGVFIGYRAGYKNTTGFDNVFIGHESGRNNRTGGDNTFIGTEAGEANTTGYDNTFIGEESGYAPFRDCSVIAAPYEIDNQRVGVLGVIGPTRMQYEEVISAVDVTARILGSALSTHPPQ